MSDATTRGESRKPSRDPGSGRVAAVDFGTVRHGVAMSNSERSIASPWENYTRRNERLDAEFFRSLAQEQRVACFVVGLPVHLSGHESQKSSEARQFGTWLEATTGVPVVFYDERFTSAEAEDFLMGAKLTSKQRKARRDMLAAQILLSAYLTGSGANDEPGGIE